jgi:hypothetical protein
MRSHDQRDVAEYDVRNILIYWAAIQASIVTLAIVHVVTVVRVLHRRRHPDLAAVSAPELLEGFRSTHRLAEEWREVEVRRRIEAARPKDREACLRARIDGDACSETVRKGDRRIRESYSSTLWTVIDPVVVAEFIEATEEDLDRLMVVLSLLVSFLGTWKDLRIRCRMWEHSGHTNEAEGCCIK